MARTSDPRALAFPRHDPRGAPARVMAAALVGLLVALLCRDHFPPCACALAGWDAASLTLLALTWWIITQADAAETRRRASAEDPGRTAVWVLVLLSSGISVFAATIVLRQARALSPESTDIVVALCLFGVASAWLLTHSAYTLRYARLFYREDDGVGGLEFPCGGPPSDYDFAYFAFTIGMCFQVSDVTISSPMIRRTVLVHALISFAYNTTILALALNLAFGMFN